MICDVVEIQGSLHTLVYHYQWPSQCDLGEGLYPQEPLPSHASRLSWLDLNEGGAVTIFPQ